jgi:two-component system NtrC family sensor kinase
MSCQDDKRPDTAADETQRVSGTRDLTPIESGPRTAQCPSQPPMADQLLSLVIEAPVDQGLEAAVSHCAAVISSLLPGCAVGLRVPRPGGGWVVRAHAVPGTKVAQDSATRLFPDFACERVVQIEQPRGSTLHVASTQTELLDPKSSAAQLIHRATHALRTLLQNACTCVRLQRLHVEVERLQARIIQGEKLASLGQIVANVVHELNNPLTSIAAYADYLGRAAAAGTLVEQATEPISRIGEATDRALKFARDLMDYAKPATDAPGPVSLEDVIAKAVAFCEHDFAANGIEVHRELDEPPPFVRGIAGHLVQVFVNLFTNAAQAMSAGGGQLRVTVRRRDAVAWIEVADTGIGVDAEMLGRIFEPYYTTRDSDHGTGLGLAIVRDIVLAHGGELRAQSAPGRGTAFSFTLPLA